MEATGVYWKPVWHVLEDSFELLLANAAHGKNVPGRKTDIHDATWLADLLAHGLLRGSFVPPTLLQELRALTRTRKQLVREKASHGQRIDKGCRTPTSSSDRCSPTSWARAGGPS
jgi:transposase